MARPDGIYPYETLIRHVPDGLGISHATITVVNGREYPGDPLPLTGDGLTALDDPALKALGESFSAAVADERDALKSQVETLTASVADRNAAISEKDATIADLRSQVASYEAVLNPPDAIYPFEFVSLLTDDQLTAVQLSTDPTLIRLRTQVQTIVTPIPFGDGSPLRNGVAYLGMVLPDLFPPEEVARIISRTAPE